MSIMLERVDGNVRDTRTQREVKVARYEGPLYKRERKRIVRSKRCSERESESAERRENGLGRTEEGKRIP